ncbi:SMI1/KNR4 family protein [archaeon]|nr:MAG: SMI1/KNR4 family protein [archaeon]
MSSDETSQCVLDIKAWFMRTRCRDDINSPASSADIQRFEKTIDVSLPKAIKTLLLEADGGMFFMDKKQLSLTEMQEFIENHEKSRKWRNGLVPLCGDDSGALVVDTENRNAVSEWDADDGLGDEVSSNIVRYLESYRNDLLSGHFEYVDGLGVIEKMAGKPRK